MKLNKIFISFLLIILIVTLSGCIDLGNGGNPSVSGENAKYYTGKTGVTVDFEDLPSKVYYYEEDLENGFDFGVKVKNEGTSLARGATFISGYDPHFMQIQGLEIEKDSGWGDCTFDLTSFGNDPSQWIGSFGCIMPNGAAFSIDDRQGNWGFNIENLGILLQNLDINIPFANTMDLAFRPNPDGSFSFDLDFDLENFDFNVMYHGAGLLMAMVPQIFETYLGKEYVLEADDYNYPGGGQDFIEYHVDINSWPPGLDVYPFPLLLTNCYGYVTYAAPLVCIDPMPLSEQRKVCTPRTMTFSSQGAPVAVTRVEQENPIHDSIKLVER